MDCGPACLKMIAAYHGKKFSIDYLRKKCYITREGVSFLGLSEAADNVGFKTMGVRIPFEVLQEKVALPCIVHWRQKHFVVVYRIKKDRVWVADPATGRVTYTRIEFERHCAEPSQTESHPAWHLRLTDLPIFTLLMITRQGSGFRFLLKYFRLYRSYFGQLFLGLLIGSCIQLIFPSLTQSIIDIGINNNDLGFIYLILFAQLALIVGRMSVEFIRGWLLLHIGSRVNVAIISGFLNKLMSLPVAFFDTRLTGDIIQRIEDNNRIEDFLTSASLSILFSFMNLIVFGIVLAAFSLKIFFIFLAGTFLYILWVSLFLKPRAKLDEIRFREMSVSSSKLINIINGMQEIKLTQSGNQ